jgi:hypothetical protein
MKSFMQWASEEKKELPLFEPLGEDTKRAGMRTGCTRTLTSAASTRTCILFRLLLTPCSR